MKRRKTATDKPFTPHYCTRCAPQLVLASCRLDGDARCDAHVEGAFAGRLARAAPMCMARVERARQREGETRSRRD